MFENCDINHNLYIDWFQNGGYKKTVIKFTVDRIWIYLAI